MSVPPFAQALAAAGRQLVRGKVDTVQVNVGAWCNLRCRHCHLGAGPHRRGEVMDRQTMREVAAFVARLGAHTVDITGGAPELVPDIAFLLQEVRPLARRMLWRTNLVALLQEERRDLLDLLWDQQVALVASFPSLNAAQADAQRGEGVWQRSLAMLQKLNALGYGVEGSARELFLVCNPAGAFLPADQCAAERRYRRELARRWGVSFTGLFVLANVPLGRFRDWLAASGNLSAYMERLAQAFNPATVPGLMCRTLVSVRWDGTLFDCDFNLAAGLPLGGCQRHVREFASLPPDLSISTGDHCYACTAGSGFT